MQRLRIAFCFAAVIGAAIFALAVESPFAGTWKLNLSKIHHFNTVSGPQIPGAPYLACFSRDMGFRSLSSAACWVPMRVMESKIEVCGIPHLAKNKQDMGHPGFVGKAGFDG
jgi:hypothetical protein